MALFDAEKMANAIVRGLTRQKTATPPDSGQNAPPTPDPQVLKLQKSLNRLNIRDNKGNVLKAGQNLSDRTVWSGRNPARLGLTV